MDKPFLELVHQSKSGNSDQSASPLARYETPLVSVDIVVFTIADNRLKVLLIQRKNEPYQHSWAIPGGFIFVGETLETSAARYLWEKTNVQNIYLEQLYSFGNPDRDPRSRVITVSYYALVSQDKLDLVPKDTVENIQWFGLDELPPLAFDHAKIVKVAKQRLKDRLENSSIAFQLLPEKFTLTELQRVYELILEKTLDKRNFRKKIISSNLLTDIGETKMEGYHRPAQLYTFSSAPKSEDDEENNTPA